MYPQNQRKIIIILFPAAIIILAASLIFDKFYKVKSEEPVQETIEINSSVIQKRFKEALLNLGIEKDWIKSESLQSDGPETKIAKDLNSYSVRIPDDLPITVVLNEVVNSFNRKETRITSQEKQINGSTLLRIYSGGILKLLSKFDYDQLINRNAGKVVMLITNLESLEGDKIKNVLSLPELFTALLVPSEKSLGLLKKLHAHNKNYSVLLNDEINDLVFKLSADYSHSRLMHSIRTILEKFPNIDFIVVDNKSYLYSSSIYDFIKNEFNERDISFVISDSIYNISSDVELNVKANFIEKVRETKKGETALIILSAQQLLMLQNEITDLRKVGYKFIKPTQIIKK